MAQVSDVLQEKSIKPYIYISSDHGGFELKRKILEKYTQELNKEFIIEDLGPYSLDPDDDYPIFAHKLASKIVLKSNSLGILICRSGIGVSIAANKIKGAYAALCFTPEHAKKSREHNNANILCLDADYGDESNHFEIIEVFLRSKFAGWNSRHGRRVKEIYSLEE